MYAVEQKKLRKCAEQEKKINNEEKKKEFSSLKRIDSINWEGAKDDSRVCSVIKNNAIVDDYGARSVANLQE